LSPSRNGSPSPKSKIAFNDLLLRGEDKDAIEAAIRRVVNSGWFVLGPEVEGFENEFSRYVGSRFAVGVASGTDAIFLALVGLGVGPGDEVITTPLTAAFTALAISRTGATPVFADVDAETLCLSPSSVRERITPRTKALVPVHLYGNACRVAEMREVARDCDHGIAVVEDACQAHGARFADGGMLGGAAEAGAFSFYPTKNLGALGDGGMIVTDDEALAIRLRRLRNGGQSDRYQHVEIGVNSRLDEMQAAILRTRLERLDQLNERRRELASLYEEGLRELPLEVVMPATGTVSARHLMVVRVDPPDRDSLTSHLSERGVQTLVHYPVPTHLQPAYAGLGLNEGSCPIAEAAAKSVLSLPLHPAMPENDVASVVRALGEFYERRSV
jgi:dTDP-4-amino-4,6-dideoxygalactose transaminase